MSSRIKNKIFILKSNLKEYLLLRNSLDHLENVIKKFYVLSIGFSDIYYENKNTKRFIICIVNWIIIWLFVVISLSFVLFDKMFSLIDVPSFSQHLKLLLILCTTFTLLIATLKTDLIFGEIYYNLSPFKVIYHLINDFKQKHKLNNENYKKLAILSRIIQILVLDLGTISISILIIVFCIKITILSGKLFLALFYTIMIPTFIIIATTGTTTACLMIICIKLF